MAVSTLKFYTTNITPEKNCKVDDLVNYLETCNKMTVGNFQYSKIKLDDTIKIDWNQNELPNFPFNYLSIKKSDDINDKTYYYFILNNSWKSENTVELQISLDTINTFWNELNWTAKTNITRQHKDRFLQKARDTSGTTRFQRIIDDYDEGINPVKFLSSEKKINDNNKPDIDWYLIYKSNPSTTTSLDCLLCVDGDFEIPVLMNGLNPAALSLNSTYYIDGADGDFSYARLSGNADVIGLDKPYKALYINKDSTGTVKVIGVAADSENSKELDSFSNYTTLARLYNNSVNLRTIPRQNTTPAFLSYDNLINDYEVLDINYIGQNKVKQFKDVDRTDTKLVKIIKMPYAPFETLDEFQWRVVFDYNRLPFLRLAELDTDFLTQINQDTFSELQKTLTNDYIDSKPVHDITMESKLYKSNFYGIRYYYDNFEKEFLLERYSPKSTNTQNIYATIKFKQSNNLSSNSLFDFELTNANYNEPTLYSRYMMVNRSQELAIYTNDYLNYIRNGYNYDKKLKASQNQANWTGFTLSTIGATASFISSIWTGGAGVAAGISFATSAVASLTNTIVTQQQSEASLAQKLEDLNRKASSVSNMDDTNLLAYYNGNRLISTREQCTEAMKKAIYNLFRLTGYSCNDYQIPSFNTREWYNFVQCKAVFDESNWRYGQDFLADIKSRFEVGITVYHKVDNGYDWNQEKENFESWLVNQN